MEWATNNLVLPMGQCFQLAFLKEKLQCTYFATMHPWHLINAQHEMRVRAEASEAGALLGTGISGMAR